MIWQDLQPFIVTGLALGGVYALSGVGMVVLYQATGVVYLAFGAVGAMGALIAFSLQGHVPDWVGWIACVVFSALVTLGYGMVFGPALAKRAPLVKAAATLGLLLALSGVMDLLWPPSGGAVRSIALPSDNGGFMIGLVQVTWTQVIGLAAGIVIMAAAAAFLRLTRLGTAMRAMAGDREITATLGVPVRRVEAAAWLGCGVLAGIAGILLADLVSLDNSTLTYLVIYTLAAALIARLRSLMITFVAALVIGLIQNILTGFSAVSSLPAWTRALGNYNTITPFVLAAIALLLFARGSVLSRSSEEA